VGYWLPQEQESGFGSNSFVIPGPVKAKALYHPIWLVLREKGEGKGDPGGWSSVIIVPNYGY
jgi:hypothetical protein